jgi:hypothetical protein
MSEMKSRREPHFVYIGIASVLALGLLNWAAPGYSKYPGDPFYFAGGVVGLSLISWILIGFYRLRAAYIAWVVMLFLIILSASN